MERPWLASGFCAAVLAAMLWPVRNNWRPEPVDGFPLSYYPMFSAKRRSSMTVHYFDGVSADGSRRRLPSSWVGSGGMNQVRRQITDDVHAGRAGHLAAKVAREAVRRPSARDLVAVEVVSGRFRLDDCFTTGVFEPFRRTVRATAPVTRAGAFR